MVVAAGSGVGSFLFHLLYAILFLDFNLPWSYISCLYFFLGKLRHPVASQQVKRRVSYRNSISKNKNSNDSSTEKSVHRT